MLHVRFLFMVRLCTTMSSFLEKALQQVGRKKTLLVVLLTRIFLFSEIINIDRPSCLSRRLSQIVNQITLGIQYHLPF